MPPNAKEVADAIKTASSLAHQFTADHGAHKAAKLLAPFLGLPPGLSRVTLGMTAAYSAHLDPEHQERKAA